MELNPYAAPQSQVLQATSRDEIIRKEYLNTEATIKSVGILYYLGAIVLILVSVIPFTKSNPDLRSSDLIPVVLFLLLSIGMGVTAYGLRRLQSWTRIASIIISSIALIIGLINLSGGIIIHIYILVKMMGKQAAFVLTPEYQQIVANTPHVKRKTSVLVWVLLIVLLMVLIGILVASKWSN